MILRNLFWFKQKVKKVIPFLIILGVASCTKAEIQYFICGFAQNIEPFTCLEIIDKK